MRLLTVGHGTLTQPDLLALFRAAGLTAVADVRRYPASRRHPHVARAALEEWLPDGGLEYRWLPALGGRRSPDPDSRHVGLRNEQFRAYADHMASAEFASGLRELRGLAAERPVAIMCAESVWWRCHRRLIADHLVLTSDVTIEHLFHDGHTSLHEPTPGARVQDGLVVYEGVDRPTLFESS